MSADFQFDVLLSHSSKDKAVVRPLAERLHAKAEVRRQKEEMELHSSAFLLRLLLRAFGSDSQPSTLNPQPVSAPLNKERRFVPPRLNDAWARTPCHKSPVPTCQVLLSFERWS